MKQKSYGSDLSMEKLTYIEEKIKKALQISKGSFKKAIGGLYKEKIIDITSKGIKLK